MNVSTIDQTGALVAAATAFARARSMEAQLRAAYGRRAPGSGGRWLDQQRDRERVDAQGARALMLTNYQAERDAAARELWVRAHRAVAA